ncbi:hypothetical protein HQN89_36525, partial [Paenibacillus frigoriresistens]|nr:hypothetical protein [Paenibacillus frigoriresistens]
MKGMMIVQNVKGTYDFFGKEQSLRKRVQSTLQEVFELYDFDGMDSTILAGRSVGIREGSELAKMELQLLLTQYEWFQNKLEELGARLD